METFFGWGAAALFFLALYLVPRLIKRTQENRTRPKLLRCQICWTLATTDDVYCPYCGYKIRDRPITSDERSKYYFMSGNSKNSNKKISLYLGSPNRIHNTLEKRNSISGKIESELSRVQEIQLSLKNVFDSELENRIESVLKRMNSVIEDLYLVRINLEFARFERSTQAIEAYIKFSNELKANTLNDLINNEKEQFKSWVQEYKSLKQNVRIAELFKAKERSLFGRFQNLALSNVSKLFSTTNMLNNSYLIRKDEMEAISFDKEIERISYEIDRINSEIDLG